VLTHLTPILELHEKHGIITEAYGPLVPMLHHPTKGGELVPVLEKIAKRVASDYNGDSSVVNQAAILLLWCKAKKVVAITTSGNSDRIKQLAKVQELPNLTKEEVEEIDAVGAKYHYRYYTEHMVTDFPEPDLPTH
jgi:diketogulonate reductase-like aldo/keto reductase